MKRLFTLICLCVLAASTSWAQQVYINIDVATGTLTYYYDNQMSSRSGFTEVYDPTRPYQLRFGGYYDMVLKAVIDPSMKEAPLTSMNSMFYSPTTGNGGNRSLKNLTVIEGLENLNTANVTDMSNMFKNCKSLTSLNLSSFRTARVTKMIEMFDGCESLTSLGLSSFNTASVTDMSAMFRGCSALTSLGLSPFNTAKVTDMSNMFNGCSALTSLGLSSFNTAKVTDMSNMFYGCSALTSLDFSSFNTASVTDMSNMFYGCSALTSLDFSSFNTASVTDMSNMFNGCSALTSLDLSPFNTANVTSMYSMFQDCSALTSLDLSPFNTIKVKNMEYMFEGCPNLMTIVCDNDWSTSSALEYSGYMFINCTALEGGKGTKYNSYVTDVTYARPDGGTSKPGYFTEKKDILGRQVYTEFVEETGTLTYYYDNKMSSRSGVTEVYDPIGHPNAVRFTGYYDKVLKAVIDPSMKKVFPTSMRSMFYGSEGHGLSNMATIEGMENLKTTNVTDMTSMFYGCNALTSLDLSSFNTANVTDMTSMFYGCNALTSLDLSPFNTANVTDMSAMFKGCSALTSLDLSLFNTDNVTDMSRMFLGCSNLTTIFCYNDWSASSVLEHSNNMFESCLALEGGKGTKYDGGKVDKTYARPDGGTSTPGYFTEKKEILEPEVYTEFVEATGTLTYYYDKKRYSRWGITKVYNQNYGLGISDGSDVLKVVIDPSMKEAPLTSARRMFNNLESMTSIQSLENLNTANVTNMSGMFAMCQSLTSLDLSSFNTANVTDMSNMFFDCASLKSLDLSSFNTENVTNMGDMFKGCSALTSLNLSSFNTANVTNMRYMFSECASLTSLNLSSFNTAKVTNMSVMFYRCASLKSLDLSSFNTENVTDMGTMFDGCSALTSLDLSSFNTENVTDMGDMFYDCSALMSLDLSSFNTENVTSMIRIFYNCSNLKVIFCNYDWSTSGVLKYSSNMFENCNALEGGKGTKFDAKFTDVTYARPDGGTSKPGYFTEKDKTLEPEVYTVFVAETGTLTYYYDMNRYFRSGLKEVYDPIGNPEAGRFVGYNDKVRKAVIDQSMKDAPLTSMKRMFWGYYDEDAHPMSLSNMTAIEGMENLNTANVTDMLDMFRYCKSLKSLDLSSFNTENVTDMSQMFMECESLKSLDLSSFNTAKVTDMSVMFYRCTSLTSLDISSFNTENVTDMSVMFNDCYLLTSLNLSSFNTEKVEDMRYMFEGCKSLTSLNLTSFNTVNVTNMRDMFQYCDNLKTIYCNDDWSTSSKLEVSEDMFHGCDALVGGKGTKLDSNVIDATYARPDGGTSNPGYFTDKRVEVYTEFAEATGTLTYYYDANQSSRSGITEEYDPVGNPDAVRFTGYDKQVLKAVIDPSMKDAPLTSMKDMFYGGMNTETYQFQTLSNMTAIEGMENLNTANATSMNNMFGSCQSLTAIDLSSFNTENVTDMEGMFMGCNKLQTLDVSTFNVSNVANMSMMFGNCKELTTIYCNSDWSIIAKSDNMFLGCTKLVGGQGTTFDSSVTNADYARPDYGFSQRGYFTRIAIRCPDGLATETYAFKGHDVYYSEDEFSEVQIGFADATTVYIQGLSKVLPEAWLKGTLIGNTLAIPETFMGIHRETDGGSWYEDYEIMFLGTTFTYDSEAETFTSSYYATNDGYDLADEYKDVTLTKLADVAATPADPEITWFYYLDSKDPSIGFNISTVDTEGNPLITKKMAYVILYMDGEGVSPLVLTKDLYPELEADRTEQPITNYVTRQEGIYRSSLNLKQSEKEVDSWRMVGIQTVYYGGGERRTSKIAWFTNPTADGIDDINGQESMANGQSIYNLAGQRLSKPAKGINIIGGRKMIK